MDLKKEGRCGLHLLAERKNRWWDVVSTVMNIRVLLNADDLLAVQEGLFSM